MAAAEKGGDVSGQHSPVPGLDHLPSSHLDFVDRFDDYLGAAYPPSGANRTDGGRRRLAESIARELRRTRSRRVLDCAAGTGCASLDLIEFAAADFDELHCCDGDPAMVAKLAERAEARRIQLPKLTPGRSDRTMAGDWTDLVINWSDLGSIEGQYDYVLCRGNSLAYADSWNGQDQVASEKVIENYLRLIKERIRSGGYLHIDAPRHAELPPTIRRVLGESEDPPEPEDSIWETVTVDEDAGRRTWRLTFGNPDEPVAEFTRYSSLLTIDQLQAIVDKLGFQETHPIQLRHERKNYRVIIARKLD